MAAMANHNIILERVNVVVEIGLGPLVSVNPLLARSVFLALMAIPKSSWGRGLLTDEIERMIKMNCTKLLHGSFVDSSEWFCTAEAAIGLIFTLHDSPHRAIGKIIRSLAEQIWPDSGGMQHDVVPSFESCPPGSNIKKDLEESNLEGEQLLEQSNPQASRSSQIG